MSNLNSVAWTQRSTHSGDSIPATGRGQPEPLLFCRVASSQPQSVRRLVLHRKRAGRNERRKARRAQRSPRPVCQRQLDERSQLLSERDGQHGGRSRRKRRRYVSNGSHTTALTETSNVPNGAIRAWRRHDFIFMAPISFTE